MGRGHLWRRVVPVSLALMCLLLPTGAARANGNNAHTWIALEALDHLPEGRLKEILNGPELQEIMLNGAIFPDGGYVVEDDYGEMSHWEPYLDSYRAWIARELGKPFTMGEAAQHSAFLMGMIAHSMADQVFDSQFMEIAKVRDSENWASGLLDGFDTATDVILVAETGHDLRFEPWVPAETLSQLFADEHDYVVDAATLLAAQDLLHRVVLSFGRDIGLNDPARVQEYREQYPWSAANLMDPQVQGSPPCEAVVVAGYMQAMWFRLHGESRPEDFVIATFPGDGGGGVPTDSRLVESQVTVGFGVGIDTSTLDDESVTVTAAGGGQHSVRTHFHYGNGSSLLRIRPNQDWAEDTEYTVTIHPGLSAITGETLEEAVSFRFSTAPVTGDPVLACTDPSPNLDEPDLQEPEQPVGVDAGPEGADGGDPGAGNGDSGCVVCASGAAARWSGIAVLGFLLVASRRRRS